MNREVLDKWCERGILGLVLGILVYGPLAMGAVRTQDFLLVQGLTIGVMLLWCVRLWVNRRPRLLWPPICWAVLAFAIYTLVRYRASDLEYITRIEAVQVLVYAFLFLAILNNLHRQEHTQLIALTLIFLAMAISFYALYQFITDSDKVWTFIKPYPHRGSGTYFSPNDLAGFLEMVLPMGLAWVLVSRAKPVMKVFVGYASLVIVAGVGVTISRGAWVSVAITLAVFFSLLLLNRTHRLPSAVLLVLLLGAGAYFVPRTHFFQERFKQIAASGGNENDVRFDLWEAAVKLWKQDIWWGIGPNHYNYRFRAVRPEDEQRQPDRVHNDYLNTLTDYGIVGFALVMSAVALLFAGVVKTWGFIRASPTDLGGRKSNKFALVLGGTMGLLAILIHSVVDFNMHIPANAITAITLMAILSGCLRFATERYWFTARLWAKIPVTLLLLAGLGYFGWEGARSAREYFWLARARHAPEYSDTQIADLQRAFSVEPTNPATAYAIGEALRQQSWQGSGDYAKLAHEAMDWFKRGMVLDPYDGYNYLRYGMCLDWLGRHKEAKPFYNRAVELDPNGYFTAANVGWHYVQTGDYAAARTWFERSRRLHWQDNPIADSYLKIVTRRMLEAATNSNPAALDAGQK